MQIEKEFLNTAERIFRKAQKEKRLIFNPSVSKLRKLLLKEGIMTKYRNFVVDTEPTSRAASFTKNSIDHRFGKEELELLKLCEKILSKQKLIAIDRRVGISKKVVRLIVPQKYSHLAYGLYRLHLPPLKIKKPNYYILVFTDKSFKSNRLKPLPEKDITIRIAFLENEAIKILRNSTYFGEVKKGIFTFEDWFAKKRGGIFLHVGCRQDYLQQVDGNYKNVVSLFAALSGNGKTTLTSRILSRKEKEKSWLIQDDGGTLYASGFFEGFEGGGIYVKTENIYPEQPEIYYGLLKPATILENVFVDSEGEFDFFNLAKTSNGRAVIRRSDFLHASQDICVSKVDNIFLITRGPLIPAVLKLTVEQGVAFMCIGMAQETSAGDPTQIGRIRNEFFYDPFITGDRVWHANRFYQIVKKIKNLNFYLLNTGNIGEGTRSIKIMISHTLSILDSIIRGGLKRKTDWVLSPFGFKVPVAVRGVDDIYFHPEKLYPPMVWNKKKSELFDRYRKVLKEIGGGLDQKIKSAF